MVLQKLWVSQNFTRISRVSQSRFFAVMCVSQSRFLYEGVSHLKQFEVSVSQSKKSKCLGLAKKNASLAVSQSLAFTIRHPFKCIIFRNASTVAFDAFPFGIEETVEVSRVTQRK